MEEEQAEELIQHCTTQKAHEVRVWLEQLQRVEQERLRRRLQLRHQRASAHTLRLQALQRRDELHRIWVEELEEARRSGEVEESSAHQLLLQYYTCQDTLEEVLDLLLANQRAQLAERHAHRRFLLQSLQSLQSVTSDAFSSSATHTRALTTRTQGVPPQCSDVHLEILRIKQDLEECVRRERRAIRCDIIKRRRQMLSEKVCEHRRQQQQVFSSSSQLSLQQFLHDYTDLLIQHSSERSQLLTQLDEETAARVRKLSLCALQRALVQLKACVSAVCPAAVCVLPQVQLMQECVQCVCEAAARELQCAVGRIRLQHQQELQQQRSSRRSFREYCSCLCVCVPSLSPEQRLRLHLECVKAACRLDRCLALHHTISESSRQQHATDPSDPAVTPEGAPAVTELQVFKQRIQERLRHSGGQSRTLQQEASELRQQQSVCEERLAVCVSALQWEQAEATARLTETHSTLLKLQTLLTAHTQDTALTHTLHTHRMALEEAELRLQQEEVQWAESAEGRGCCDEEAEQEGVFMVNGDSSVSVLLQEALWKRQQLQRWTHRNQTLHQEQRLQVNRLQVYCEQDLAFTAALVRQSLISVPDLHEVLRLLLPTGPEGELLSLIDALGPREEEASGRCRALAQTLKRDMLSRTAQHTHRETQRLMKKRQQCLDALLSANTPEDQQRRRRHTRDQPEAELARTHDNEGAWPIDVPQGRIDSTRTNENEGAWPVTQGSIDSTRTHDIEGVWPVGVAQGSIDSSERLFVFRCAPPTAQQNTHTHTRKKKRSFLNFKKSSVAPQPHT
ncbi:limbin isoform X2 [Danio aesculapii]|uniref:limbin isoform X2 n=1 Tax=Danio aesculapii TaxID=1142201 RepID=UPI0024C0160A|nr:limbin isoform X2 [Danio aesculapii]